MSDEKPPPDDLDSTVTSPSPTITPGRIGPYKILQKLGEGGMGVVYLGEQEHPIRRRVALKIIKLGMDTKAVIARFEAERQALAMMNHPNVAKVFDAGTTEQGRPYFIMEHVPGISITQYCDQQRLTTQERLGLFIAVCEAIQHAHQKGIIHRDIKPSNVLVSVQDGKPVPKVIDFGVAKATSQRLTEKTVYTQAGMMVGTPEYMSPEQAGTTALDVDTRTDVYSLGVVLYELLVGALPFERRRLRTAAALEMMRIIREEEPPRPSTRLNTLGEELTDVANRRRAEPKTLSRLVRGDLDWIVMRSLEKDRTRRYATANELARDLEHHLASEPIVAGPPGVAYKLRKFIRRNRVAVTGSSVVAVALVLGFVLATIGFVQANRERDRATEAEREAKRQAYAASISAAESALFVSEIAKVRRHLEAAPEELRNWEWHHLDVVTDDSLKVIGASGRQLTSVAYSPDGTRLASGSGDRTVQLWDVASGKELAVMKGHDGAVTSVAFGADGTRLASASYRDKTVRLWDPSTAEELSVMRGHKAGILSLAFSPDGRRLASGSDRAIRLWDARTGRELAVMEGHGDRIFDLAFSPDGARLASASQDDKPMRVWDAGTGEELGTLWEQERIIVFSLAFSPDGKRLASGVRDADGHYVRLLDAFAGDEIALMRGHEDDVNWLSFSPDGTRLASASDDKTVRIWDVATTESLAVLRGHEHAVSSSVFSPDGARLASASRDGTIRLWDASMGEGGSVLRGHADSVSSAAFSPDGTRLVSVSGWGGTMNDNTVRVWDMATGEQLATLASHDDAFWTLAYSPQGDLVASSTGDDHLIRVWNASTAEEEVELRGHVRWISSLAFGPNGELLASASVGDDSIDDPVRIWDVRTGQVRASLRGADGGAYYVAFSPDGAHLATAESDGSVRLWDVASGQGLSVLEGHRGRVFSVAFSPDGTRLASGGASNIRLWDASTGAELAVLRGHEYLVECLAFSPDGTRIASGSYDDTVRVWDASTGEQLLVLRGPENTVASVAFSPDGTRLAAASWDYTIRIWHTKPYRDRMRERQDVLEAQSMVESKVDAIWRESIDLDAVAERLRTDSMLSKLTKRAALNLSLKRSTELKETLNALFARRVFSDEVVTALHSDDSLSEGERYRAVTSARRRGDEPHRLNEDSWSLVRVPGRGRQDYELGLRGAEAAVATAPENAAFLGTLGMAQYRNRLFEDAVTTLTRCDQMRQQEVKRSSPRDVAVLAMALFELGRSEEARFMFDRLEDIMDDPEKGWIYHVVETALFEECRVLLGLPDPDGE